jgi:hypothetical protein
LALRQSEGLIASIMGLLEIDLPVPDHTTLSRRACGLPISKWARMETGDLHLSPVEQAEVISCVRGGCFPTSWA